MPMSFQDKAAHTRQCMLESISDKRLIDLVSKGKVVRRDKVQKTNEILMAFPSLRRTMIVTVSDSFLEYGLMGGFSPDRYIDQLTDDLAQRRDEDIISTLTKLHSGHEEDTNE